MKNALKINTTFTRIEFWAATTIFAFIMLYFITDGFDQGNAAYKSNFEKAGVPFDFYKHFFIPQLIRNLTIFLTLLYVNFIIVPKLLSRQKLLLNFALLVFVFLVAGVIFGVTDYFLRAFIYNSNQGNATEIMFGQGLDHAIIIFAVLAVYTLIKYISLTLLSIAEKLESKFRFIRREAIVATFIWGVILLCLIMANVPGVATAAWLIAIPTAILLYLLGFYSLIPSSLNNKYPFVSYALKNVLILFLVLMAWGLVLKLVVGGIMSGDKAPLAALWMFNSVLQMFITVPVTWFLYKRQMKGNEQLNVLKKELGQSNASFDFLRSQINPHFLFNVLNTLYGTAIQESAERTSEGIQKLGDMMRFMLQENMQDKIPLSREIEYLNNYISLQKLRVDNNPIVQINTEIQDSENDFQIAPMLLIPFVENAFKHGISFREPSHIKVMLEIKDSTLYFNVNNSKHSKQENDPEIDKSGIGLENVSQRLKLLYPNKHELIIRDTTEEFFIRLTINLPKFV